MQRAGPRVGPGTWLDPNRHQWEDRAVPATTVPYTSSECGERFTDFDDFNSALDRFLANAGAGRYAPHRWVAENLSMLKRIPPARVMRLRLNLGAARGEPRVKRVSCAMILSAHKRILTLMMVAVSSFSEAIVVSPQRLEAAPIAGHTYDFTVFVNHRHLRVTGTPIEVAQGAAISIDGWALDSRTMKPATSVLIGIDGGKPVSVDAVRMRRPDVVRVVHDPDAATSGFSTSVPTLAPGLHQIRISVIEADGSESVLPTNLQITVGGH